MALPTGATLCLPPPGPAARPGAGRRCCAQRITTVTLPPSVLGTAGASRCRTCALLVVGRRGLPGRAGRALGARPALLQRLRSDRDHGLRDPGAMPARTSAAPPIGRPMPGRAGLRPGRGALSRCRSACPGELYIGGAGVARGYLNRPELTAERFVARSVRRRRGRGCTARAICVRWRADGDARVPGPPRRPGQAARLPHRAGRGRGGAAAAPGGPRRGRGGEAGTPGRPASGRLRRGPQRRADADRHRAAARLPRGAGCRSTWCPRPSSSSTALPLTPNGKVDRAALPSPEARRPEGGVGVRAPRSGLERALAGIWGKLLGLDRVGIDDTFFEPGRLLPAAGPGAVRDRGPARPPDRARRSVAAPDHPGPGGPPRAAERGKRPPRPRPRRPRLPAIGAA